VPEESTTEARRHGEQQEVCPTCGTVLTAGAAPCIAYGELKLDPLKRIAHRDGKKIKLSFKESQLLAFLMSNPGIVFTRTAIINGAWKMPLEELLTNEVDVYINYLRNKIDAGFPVKLIHTKRMVGYFFGTVQQAKSQRLGANS
jgi:DNA-binding response OmpR family regulator